MTVTGDLDDDVRCGPRRITFKFLTPGHNPDPVTIVTIHPAAVVVVASASAASQERPGRVTGRDGTSFKNAVGNRVPVLNPDRHDIPTK